MARKSTLRKCMARTNKNFQAFGLVSLQIATMPWACQEAAVQQILREPDEDEQLRLLQEWKKWKNSEFTNVGLIVSIGAIQQTRGTLIILTQGALLASATTGSLQWGILDSVHWIVPAAWYITLILSLMGVMFAFYLTILLSNFAINKQGDKLLLNSLGRRSDPQKPAWISLFALQVPMMILSYSLISYITGLSVMVLIPLWSDPWGNGTKVCKWL